MSNAANRLEAAAAATAGPLMVNIFGYNVPVLAAILSLAGVILASAIAPPASRPLNRPQAFALVGLLCVLVIAMVVSDPARSLFVSVCFAIGIGYSGLPVIQAIRDRFFPQVVDIASAQAPTSGD